MSSEQNDLFQQEEEKATNIDVHALLIKYLSYWHLFAISVVVLLIAAWIYLRFQAPVYSVSSAVLIQEDNSSRSSSSSPIATMQDLGMVSMTSSFDNELEVLHSRTLLKEVVTTLNLYSSVSERRVFGYAAPLYGNSPVNIFMTPDEAAALEAPVTMDMDYKTTGTVDVKLSYVYGEKEETVKERLDTFPAVLTTPVGVITFTLGDSTTQRHNASLKGYIYTPMAVAKGYGGSLSVSPTSKTTTIAQITLQDTHRKRAVDFINCLVEHYNQNANDDKNEVASKTAEFIEDRLQIINSELGNTESQLAAFKQRSGITDLTSNAQQALTESSRYNQQRVENETQISLVKYLRDYINSPENRNEVIPSNVGLADQQLSTVIDQYNTLLSERRRLLLTSSEENPAVKKLDISLDAMRKSVQTTVASVLKGLQITRSDIERQASKYESRISEAPTQEKEFISIARQQEIKATLYTMLLQKREENAITLAATANNGRIIEEALADNAPVSPKTKIIYLVALILGLGIPVAIIYVIDLFRYKIESREDIEKLTHVPVIGEIPLGKRPEKGAIVVHENQNEMMEDVIRAVRTNRMFTLPSTYEVIMFSSTMPGEGKSFIAGNIAVSLAIMGKKVIVVGLDIRKPGLNKVFNLSSRVVGVTNYLGDPENADLADLIQHSDISPNLDVLPGGPVPPNPTELLARTALDDMIAKLKKKYDYILMDTAPIGMVTDSALISRVADALVYVCRADYTPKEGFKYINTLHDELKLSNICTVLNAVDLSSRKNSYGYGYGKKYGYGYGKRYGYGYGYGSEEKKKSKK